MPLPHHRDEAHLVVQLGPGLRQLLQHVRLALGVELESKGVEGVNDLLRGLVPAETMRP